MVGVAVGVVVAVVVLPMTSTLDDAAIEFTKDLVTVMQDGNLETDGSKEVLMKYARLVMVRDALPHVLMSLQYYTENQKGKEAITMALKLLAAAKGKVL